jgi:hypothetical protein
MAKIGSIITIDWRKYGDFSAVGQLTEKIFTEVEDFDVYSVQVLDDYQKCRFFKRSDNGNMESLVSWPIFQDAAMNELRSISPTAIYIRLSPHKPTLEFACKLAATLNNVPLIVHFMDTPYLIDMRNSTKVYILAMYKFLMNRASAVYTIHSSSLQWIKDTYGKNANVLGNFIKFPSKKEEKKETLQKVSIAYFGSIDRKMNAATLISFAKIVRDLEWVEFSIWSNSGIWGELKELSEGSSNIKIRNSNLTSEEYTRQIQKADYLLLPYNMDDQSIEFLRHSYSNKFIDYVESGGKILCVGPNEIPTVKECIESNVGIVATDLNTIQEILINPESLNNAAVSVFGSEYTNSVTKLSEHKKELIAAFINYLGKLAEKQTPSVSNCVPIRRPNKNSQEINNILSFLIKRKFYDHQTRKQSLAATLASSQLKSYGYKGFDYEI